jgi:hypothetical protein
VKTARKKLERKAGVRSALQSNVTPFNVLPLTLPREKSGLDQDLKPSVFLEKNLTLNHKRMIGMDVVPKRKTLPLSGIEAQSSIQ